MSEHPGHSEVPESPERRGAGADAEPSTPDARPGAADPGTPAGRPGAADPGAPAARPGAADPGTPAARPGAADPGAPAARRAPSARRGAADPAYLFLTIPLLLLALFWNLDLVPAYLEEPRRAIVAMEMMFRGDYIVPTQLGEIYVNKPPLFNWALIAAYKANGSFAEWIPRSISVLSLLGMGYILYRFALRHGGKGTVHEDRSTPFEPEDQSRVLRNKAACAGLMTVLCADIFFYFSTTGEIDLFYSLITLGGMLAVFHFDQAAGLKSWQRISGLYVLPWVLAAAGMLTKGFPSPIFAGLTYLAWFALRGRWRALFHPAQALGALAFAAICGAYFYAYDARADLPNYLAGLFDQSSQRTAGRHAGSELIRHLLLFAPDTLKNIAPASLFLPWLLHPSGRRAARNHPMLLFCLLVFAGNIWLYWISPGTRPRYVYMLYPLLILPLVWSYRPALFRWEKALAHLIFGFERLLPLGLLATPFLLQHAGLSVPVYAWPLYVTGALAAAWLLHRSSRRYDLPARIILLLILARVLFDAAVLPQRAEFSHAAPLRDQALQIAEAAQGRELRLLGRRNAGDFPLTSAYYMERSRREVLYCDTAPRAGVWYIAEPHQLDTTLALRMGSLNWKNFRFGLFAYTGPENSEEPGSSP